MTWSANRVRRRLQIPRDEPLLAWARADIVGLRVPFPVMGAIRRWVPYVALTDTALWVCRAGVTARFGLEQVVMASLVDRPDGALRVDFLTGEPLIVLVADGGVFVHCLSREIRGFDRQLRRGGPTAPVGAGIPWTVAEVPGMRHPCFQSVSTGGDVACGTVQERYTDDVRALLHEAELIIVRELRHALSGSGSSGGRTRP